MALLTNVYAMLFADWVFVNSLRIPQYFMIKEMASK